MSGFVAVVARDGGRVDPRLLETLGAPLEALHPDAVATHDEGPVGLVSAFLSTRRGATPGPHTDGRGLWLCGDIRLDDRDALVARLGAAGIDRADREDDDALVLAAYRAWGDASLERLRGDFSFALWDRIRGRLLCARDGLGVRPLFFTERGGTFACSNSVMALRAHPAVTRELHEPAIVSFLQWGFNADPRTTTFADISRLEAGHSFVVSIAEGRGEPRRHWTFPAPEPLLYRREAEYVERFRELLDVAVLDRLRMPSATILMSGGLDSTALAATVRRVAPTVALKAYTSTSTSQFDDQEGRLAAAVAKRLGVQHVINDDVRVPLSHLDDPAFRSPEPLDDITAAFARRLWADAARHGRVMIIGEDGDTLLQPPGLRTTVRYWPLRDVVSRYAKFVAAKRRAPHLGFWLRKRLRGVPVDWIGPPVPAWIRTDVIARTGTYRHPAAPLKSPRPEMQKWLTGPLWQAMQEADAFDYMRQAIEVRWPLLDERLITFAAAIPPVPWCQQKEILRVAFRDELPSEVINRPKTPFRGGDGADVRLWRRATSETRVELSDTAVNFVDPQRLQRTLNGSATADVLAAWRALELDQWLRTY